MTYQIAARLTLYVGPGKRQTPFRPGYRPLFAVTNEELVSGMIELQDRSEMRPGETADVLVKFVHEPALFAGMRIQFFESVQPLGHIEVLQVFAQRKHGGDDG